VIRTYLILDLVTLAILGAAIGGMLLGFAALRQSQSVASEAAIGVLLGGLAAPAGLLGSVLTSIPGPPSSRLGFIAARLFVWVVAGSFLGALLASRFAALDRRRPLDGALFGAAAGAIAALIVSLSGPAQLWQLIAFMVLGLGVGYGSTRIDRAVGVVVQVGSAARAGTLLGHREWEVFDGRSIAIEARMIIHAGGGLIQAHSLPGASPLSVSGRVGAAPFEVRDRDLINAGDRAFQFHLRPGRR
jgi:hypothetical protein